MLRTARDCTDLLVAKMKRHGALPGPVKPSLRSFARAENKAVDRYLEAGAGAAGLKALVFYLKRWRRSLGLWNATWAGKWYQRLALFAGTWHKGAATLKPLQKAETDGFD